MSVLLLAASALGIGFLHSLSPGHWLPVVLVARTRRWNSAQALAGAVVAASGHILVSAAAALVSLALGATVLAEHEEQIERFAALGMAAFGAGYALWVWRRHAHCHGHEHHGPHVSKTRPYAFLFTIGFTPCIAVLPVLAAAGAYGIPALVLAFAGFVAGVLLAFSIATVGVSRGLLQLDHPWLEHYGDMITGLAVMVLGLALWALH